jgi:hypothetical protein
MKKTIFYLSLLLVFFSGMTSCKKGENDPSLSLKSRKARLTGEWKLSTAEIRAYSDGELEYSASYNGTFFSDSDGDVTNFFLEYTFDKSGTYTNVYNEDGETRTRSGNWAFLGKSSDADLKKKEALLFDETKFVQAGFTSTSSHFNPDNSSIWILDRLSKDEMIMKQISETSDSDGDNEKTEYIFTFTKLK